MATGRAGVFAGGDVVSGPKTIIDAVASGRRAAGSIHEFPSRAPDGNVDIFMTLPDEVPPPLEDEPAPGGDHVDRDIDELLVSLQEMEHEATVEEEPEEPAPMLARAAKTQTARSEDREASQRASALQKKRDSVVSYFAGPALAAIGAIGISAAMLPGSDAFLQSYYELNTSLLLGLGYTFAGIAAYVAASILLMTRTK